MAKEFVTSFEDAAFVLDAENRRGHSSHEVFSDPSLNKKISRRAFIGGGILLAATSGVLGALIYESTIQRNKFLPETKESVPSNISETTLYSEPLTISPTATPIEKQTPVSTQIPVSVTDLHPEKKGSKADFALYGREARVFCQRMIGVTDIPRNTGAFMNFAHDMTLCLNKVT